MDPVTIANIVLSVLSAVETLLPMLGVSGSSVNVVDGIIATLTKIMPVVEKIMPLATNEISLIYQGIKNIIANIRGTDTTAAQDAALDSLDAQVDAAWNTVTPKFDPDFTTSGT